MNVRSLGSQDRRPQRREDSPAEHGGCLSRYNCSTADSVEGIQGNLILKTESAGVDSGAGSGGGGEKIEAPAPQMHGPAESFGFMISLLIHSTTTALLHTYLFIVIGVWL